LTEGVIGVAFLGAAIYPFIHQGPTTGPKVTIENRENNSVTVTPMKP
jgi:hypothetical protein